VEGTLLWDCGGRFEDFEDIFLVVDSDKVKVLASGCFARLTFPHCIS